MSNENAFKFNGMVATQLIWYVCAWITIMMCDDEYVCCRRRPRRCTNTIPAWIETEERKKQQHSKRRRNRKILQFTFYLFVRLNVLLLLFSLVLESLEQCHKCYIHRSVHNIAAGYCFSTKRGTHMRHTVFIQIKKKYTISMWTRKAGKGGIHRHWARGAHHIAISLSLSRSHSTSRARRQFQFFNFWRNFAENVLSNFQCSCAECRSRVGVEFQFL